MTEQTLPAGTRRYATVNGAWPEGPLPKLDGPEAISAVKRLYRFAMKRKLAKTLRVTSGRRHTSIYRSVVNPDAGWRDLVHSVSHHCHWRLHPGVKPHDDLGRHAFLEREMIDHVVKSGWLDGKLKSKAKPKTKVPVQQERYLRIIERMIKWQAKANRAEIALRKLRRQQRYYEKKAA